MTPPNLLESQLFLDDRWIADSIRVGRVWHQARKRAEPVLRAESAWEGSPVLYGSVLLHEDLFRMWYVSWQGAFRGFISYAESADGIHWVKPELGLVSIHGSAANNAIFGGPDVYVDNLGVVADPSDRRWPLTMIYWVRRGAGDKAVSGLAAARSRDGRTWDFTPGMVLPGWGDRTNVLPARDQGRIVVFGREPGRVAGRYGCRTVCRTESRDLRLWSRPELVLKPDPEDDPHMEIYSMSPFRYESLYLGAIERMHMAPDVLDPEICFSQDGHDWRRPRARPAFLERGPAGSWDSHWVNLASAAPIRRNGELLFYYSGRACGHASHAGYRVSAIGLASLRVDGFCSLRSVDREGWLVTPPLRWAGAELLVNADPRRDLSAHPRVGGGEVRAEVRDAAGRPLKGYGFDDCVPVTTNTAYAGREDSMAAVRWKRAPLRALAGRRIRLAFRLRDAHLYSFKAE